jgi:anti-sigma B factor antagonist
MRDKSSAEASIELEMKDEVAILHMAGQMRELGADALREELDKLIEDGSYKLVFDLSDVTFISSVGLGQLMRAYRNATSHEGYVRIVNPQPLVEEVFRFTKLHTLIGIFDTIDEAIQAE